MKNKRIQPVGLSLIELMIVLMISSLIMGIMVTQGPSIAKTSIKLTEKGRFNESYYIFMMLLERDFQEAELITSQQKDGFNHMTFYSDHNRDEDYLDSSERKQYRWNSAKQRMELKSGNGYFQSLLENVVYFQWSQTREFPESCFQLKLKSSFDSKERLQLFCRSD